MEKSLSQRQDFLLTIVSTRLYLNLLLNSFGDYSLRVLCIVFFLESSCLAQQFNIVTVINQNFRGLAFDFYWQHLVLSSI